MIPQDHHTQEWLLEQQERHGMTDPIILEKAVFALTLLDLLARSELDFIFKGGTALLLHLPEPNRLSIDIDIVCDASQADFEDVLTRLVSESLFLRWDESVRGEQGLPGRRHYRFHYLSPVEKRESHVLLDVVTEVNFLEHIVTKPVATSFLDVPEPTFVRTPCLESLLGDKMTAFAPRSIGVPLTEQYSQQVIKQLFDIAQLFDHAENLEIVSIENRNSFQAEAGYRKYPGSHSDYLDDLIDTAFHICSLDLRGAPKNRDEEGRLLKRGIGQLGSHLFSKPFKLPEAKVAAAKAACLAKILKSGSNMGSLPRFDPARAADLKEYELEAPFSCLNRLRGFAPEAFFYWL
jgi:hypothetical protein